MFSRIIPGIMPRIPPPSIASTKAGRSEIGSGFKSMAHLLSIARIIEADPGKSPEPFTVDWCVMRAPFAIDKAAGNVRFLDLALALRPEMAEAELYRQLTPKTGSTWASIPAGSGIRSAGSAQNVMLIRQAA